MSNFISKVSLPSRVEYNLIDSTAIHDTGDGLEHSDGTVSIKLDTQSDFGYISVSQEGLKLSGISSKANRSELTAPNIYFNNDSFSNASNVDSAIVELYNKAFEIEKVILWDKELDPSRSDADFVADNPEVFGDTITLSDSLANYDSIEVFAITDDKYKLIQKVDKPNGYGLNLQQVVMGYSSMIVKCKTYSMSGNTLTLAGRGTTTRYDYAGIAALPASGATGVQNTGISPWTRREKTVFGIYKIIGYKNNATLNNVISTISEMSLADKIGQMFIVRPEQLALATYGNNYEANNYHGAAKFPRCNSDMKTGIDSYHPGGFIMFPNNINSNPSHPEYNIETFISDINTRYTSNHFIKPFICVDEEGGRVARLSNTIEELPKYSSTSDVAQGGVSDVREMGKTIGAYLEQYGFNVNFAPVADVNSNPDNPVIGTRSFSENPMGVADCVSNFIEGLHDGNNVLATLKHFPGHGDTQADSHIGAADINKTWEQMLSCEIIPFAMNKNNTDFIMVGHLGTPLVTTDNLPASLSYQMVTEKLRNEIGYDGVVITDGMEMGAIKNTYSALDAAKMAINAGCDIILCTMDFPNTYQGIIDAVSNGEISVDRIDESVNRILRLKQKLGLLNL